MDAGEGDHRVRNGSRSATGTRPVCGLGGAGTGGATAIAARPICSIIVRRRGAAAISTNLTVLIEGLLRCRHHPKRLPCCSTIACENFRRLVPRRLVSVDSGRITPQPEVDHLKQQNRLRDSCREPPIAQGLCSGPDTGFEDLKGQPWRTATALPLSGLFS
jgi:hypothetical protein